MDNKSLIMLEYPQVINRLKKYASFSLSEERAEKLHPYTDPDIIRYRLEMVREARHLLSVNDSIQLGGCLDISQSLLYASKGGTLEGTTLWRIAYMMILARDLSRSLRFHAEEYPELAKFSDALQPPHGLIERINNTVTDHGEVLDSASPALAEIRRKIRSSYSKLLGKLERMLKDSRYQSMIQEAIITQRNGRYVIPIKSEYRGQLKSIVHDQSSSGATLFVEPLATVEINNEYQELLLSERDESLRVLAALSAELSGSVNELRQMMDALTEIDFTLMCAKYADDINAAEPILAEKVSKNGNPVIKLYEARHPLLASDQVVPIDVVLNDDIFCVVITGPNTGGKTVSLKTIGLMILMMQSGLHIPAQSGSELSLFSDVFADMGDEQSIEQSLSTFSGHMTNLIRILRNATPKTLLLLDELGSGTDPQEGSALARAVMQYITDKHIPCFAATHFSDLKAFAHTTAGTTNASMEFNLKTLRPTYRLSIGLPGRSNALLIAKRLGLPEEILENAKQTIDPTDMNTDSLLDEIHRQFAAAKTARSQADRSRSLAENSNRALQKRLDEIDKEREQILAKSQKEAQDELSSLRDEVASLKKELLRIKAPLTEVALIETAVKKAEKQLKTKTSFSSSKKNDSILENTPFKVGEKVRVRNLGTDSLAVISALSENEAEIQLGALRMRVQVSELRHKSEEEQNSDETTAAPERGTIPTERIDGNRPIFHESPGTEIDLRGKMSDEGIDLLDKYIDDAVLAGLPYVRVIHGKGTGRLRQVTRQFLHASDHVSYIETGKDAEGGDGVTIAHLKT